MADPICIKHKIKLGYEDVRSAVDGNVYSFAYCPRCPVTYNTDTYRPINKEKRR